MTAALPSYSSGTSSVPLLGDTIGDNLARTVARFPDREALVDVPTGRRWTYARAGRRRGRARPRPARGRGRQVGDRVGIWSPNCAGVDPAAVRDGQGRRDAGQRQPGLPQPRAGLRRQPVRACGCWSAPSRTRARTTAAMVEQVRGECPALTDVVFIGEPGWDELVGRGAGVDPERLAERMAGARHRRPDQHPVHLGHDRLPQGRDPEPPQHPQQRLLRRRAGAATPSTTGSACRCPSTTASAWSWATWRPPRTGPAW